MSTKERLDISLSASTFPVLGRDIPVKTFMEWRSRTPGENILLLEFPHKAVEKVDCNGKMRVKVISSIGGLGQARCLDCHKEATVDLEEIAIRPYQEALQNIRIR